MSRSHFHWRFLRLINGGLFRVVWPTIARMPIRTGMWFAQWVGLLCYKLDLDWRTLAVSEHHVTHRTRLALAEICPTLPLEAIEHRVKCRFINAAHEELEGHWFALNRTPEMQCEFEGLEVIREGQQQGRGIVLLTLHFDAALMGVAQLGLSGMKLNLMTSNIVEDVRVSASVQRYFARKYAGLETCFNGGHAMHVETSLRNFYNGIHQGESAIILSEGANDKRTGAVIVDFLGKKRAIAPGAIRIAEKTGAPIAAFICNRLHSGHYRVIFSPLYWPSPDNSHADNACEAFAFLDRQIRRHPERWWASDVMYNYIDLDA